MIISKRYSLLSSKNLMLLRIANAPALIKPELTKTETYNDIWSKFVRNQARHLSKDPGL